MMKNTKMRFIHDGIICATDTKSLSLNLEHKTHYGVL